MRTNPAWDRYAHRCANGHEWRSGFEDSYCSKCLLDNRRPLIPWWVWVAAPIAMALSLSMRVVEVRLICKWFGCS